MRLARRASLLALSLALALAPAALADVESGRSAIRAEAARQSVDVLASDALEGRGSGAEGGRRAGAWLAEQLAALGLAPAGTDGYFQPFEGQGQRMRNVLATIPGREPGEQVVIGAHYDHLGTGHQAGSLELLRGRGKVHNGADDNASGTACLLEVARAFVASGLQPRRRIVFAWFDGEERGLLGSEHLLAHPPFPGERPYLMINLDMVGRLRDRKLTVFGANTGDRLKGWLEQANAGVGLPLDLRETMQDNSDHAGFYRAKVPVVAPFTGLHADYHRPSDDVERLDVEGIARIARLVFELAVTAADAQEPLVFAQARDGTGEAMLEQLQAMLGVERFDERLRELRERFGLGEGATLEELGKRLQGLLGGGRGRGGRARLGVTLDGEADGPGVRVREVTAGSPADRAGVRAGDRIVAADGRPVEDVDGLRARVAAARGGLALDLERDGQPLQVVADLGGGETPPAPPPPPAPTPPAPGPGDGRRWF